MDYGEHLVLAFLDCLLSSGYSYSHVVKTLAGISFFVKWRGLPSCSSFFSVRQVLKGYRRSNFSVDTRVPVTVDMLRALIAATDEVCSSVYEARLFKVSLSVCFFGAFRISELLTRSSFAVNGLFYSDVTFTGDCIHILIRGSKTDQLGRGRIVTITRVFDCSICACQLLAAYCPVWTAVESHLFIHVDGLPLTQFQFFGCAA